MKRLMLSAILASGVVFGLTSRNALAYVGSCAPPQNLSIEVRSGGTKSAGTHYSDNRQGNPIPFTLKPLANPKNGKLVFNRHSLDVSVIYKSRPGFVGQDNFQYVRVSDDGYAGTYTVAVTVK